MNAIVVKVGGGLLASGDDLDVVLAEIAAASRNASLVVVPGGGPFADTVREVDRRLALADDAAHWMAVLAMDQYAHLIASRVGDAALVRSVGEIEAARAQQRLPVLAPYEWMRDADPLPHSWDITSDSIAAWVAGQVGASRLVLVKPAGASGPAMVDVYFDRANSTRIDTTIVAANRIEELRRALHARRV